MKRSSEHVAVQSVGQHDRLPSRTAPTKNFAGRVILAVPNRFRVALERTLELACIPVPHPDSRIDGRGREHRIRRVEANSVDLVAVADECARGWLCGQPLLI